MFCLLQEIFTFFFLREVGAGICSGQSNFSSVGVISNSPMILA